MAARLANESGVQSKVSQNLNEHDQIFVGLLLCCMKKEKCRAQKIVWIQFHTSRFTDYEGLGWFGYVEY